MLSFGHCEPRRLTLYALFALVAGLLPFSSPHDDLPSSDRIQSGDIVFIRGKSIRSAVVRLLEGGNSDYSHVGIIVLENGTFFIVHASPAPDATGDRVIKEPWDAIISPSRIAAAAVFRLTDPSKASRLGLQAAKVAQQFERDALPFDHDFDLMTRRKLYCTELVWRAYLATGIDLRGSSFGSSRRYLLPLDLIKSGLLRDIRERPRHRL